MREFPLNSRHPGPRREEGGPRAAVQMPLPRDPGDPGDQRHPRENSRRLHSMRRCVQIDTFAQNWASNFREIRENRPGHPKAPQGSPRDPQRDPRWTLKGLQGSPWGLHGVPNGPKGSPKGAKWAPKSSQGHPKAIPRATKTSQKDKLYINKLPINRLRGRYVSNFNHKTKTLRPHDARIPIWIKTCPRSLRVLIG